MLYEHDKENMLEATRDSEGNLRLPARVIPVPKSISPEAQKALAGPAYQGAVQWPQVSDKSVWKSFISELDAGLASKLEALPPFPGKIELRNVGSAKVFEFFPDDISAAKHDRAVLYVHGGAYVVGGGQLAAKMSQTFATLVRTKVYAVDYRMPPDHPYPVGMDDVVTVYRDLLTRHKPGNVAVVGVSAGGGLAAASILKLRDIGLPLPGVAVLLTPEADLTESGDSFETNKYIDQWLVQRLTEPILLYANGHDLREPYLSPIFGDFSRGFPPTLLISGTRDLFLSNTVRLHRALRKARIEADLYVFEAMPHGSFGSAPEDAECIEEQIRFIDKVLERG